VTAQGQVAVIGSSEEQQVLAQPGEQLGLGQRRSHRALELPGGAPAAQSQLQLGLQPGDRRAHLVAGVGDERALQPQCRLQPLERGVERLAEPPQLVTRSRQRQPAPGGFR
jgi:hypothetical protein